MVAHIIFNLLEGFFIACLFMYLSVCVAQLVSFRVIPKFIMSSSILLFVVLIILFLWLLGLLLRQQQDFIYLSWGMVPILLFWRPKNVVQGSKPFINLVRRFSYWYLMKPHVLKRYVGSFTYRSDMAYWLLRGWLLPNEEQLWKDYSQFQEEIQNFLEHYSKADFEDWQVEVFESFGYRFLY